MDFGCGCGDSTIALAKAFPNSSVFGFDIDERSIDRANSKKSNVQNVSFRCQDVFTLDPNEHEKYDLCTFLLCLHDMSQGSTRFPSIFYNFSMNSWLSPVNSYPTNALRIAKGLLKKGGSIIVLEIASNPVFDPTVTSDFGEVAESVLHCLPCSRPLDQTNNPGEDIGNPFRFDQLKSVAVNAGFSTVSYYCN